MLCGIHTTGWTLVLLSFLTSMLMILYAFLTLLLYGLSSIVNIGLLGNDIHNTCSKEVHFRKYCHRSSVHERFQQISALDMWWRTNVWFYVWNYKTLWCEWPFLFWYVFNNFFHVELFNIIQKLDSQCYQVFFAQQRMLSLYTGPVCHYHIIIFTTQLSCFPDIIA